MSEIGKTYRKALTGKRNREAGEAWENMIEAACRNYRLYGLAEIEKVPEPMRPISRPNAKGQFLACFEKQAQPDYQGTLKGGQSVVFEAKHTSMDRMERKVISEEQEKKLNRHQKLGAMCFVLVSFSLKKFYRIPWEVFRDMKDHYGRKYIKPEDIEEYEVKFFGYLRFL